MRKVGQKLLAIASATAFVLVTTSLNLFNAHAVALTIEEGLKNNIRYMSGGVGLDERAAMEKKAKDYNLKIVFAATSGRYLAQIEIQIQDRSGKLLFTGTSNGPWFFVDLPQGGI